MKKNQKVPYFVDLGRVPKIVQMEGSAKKGRSACSHRSFRRTHEIAAIQSHRFDLRDLFVREALIDLTRQLQDFIRVERRKGSDHKGHSLVLGQRQGLQRLEHAVFVNSFHFLSHHESHPVDLSGRVFQEDLVGQDQDGNET